MYEFLAIITTLFIGRLGSGLGSFYNDDFSGIFSVATMGYFILRKIKKNEIK
ncbi:MAG: hypothetical protein ACFWUA_00325 [Sporanaerobacter sp.]|jgi:hypothetical protein|uniref:hypothetical protein n=1 Tax=Sporanaerobacter sp. TaxID=2010183 RepID=UPI003A0FC67B